MMPAGQGVAPMATEVPVAAAAAGVLANLRAAKYSVGGTPVLVVDLADLKLREGDMPLDAYAVLLADRDWGAGCDVVTFLSFADPLLTGTLAPAQTEALEAVVREANVSDPVAVRCFVPTGQELLLSATA